MGQIYRSREEFQRLARVHRYNAIGVGILLLTGLLLFATPLRGLLAPIRVPMKGLHIWGGLALALFAFATAQTWLSMLVRPGLHLGRRLNTILTVLWLAGWTVTGILMWLRGSIPYTWANAATTLHDWLTWTALPWILLHVAFRLAKVRRPGERIELSSWLTHPATRRGFVQAGLIALGPAWLWRSPSGSWSATSTASPAGRSCGSPGGASGSPTWWPMRASPSRPPCSFTRATASIPTRLPGSRRWTPT